MRWFRRARPESPQELAPTPFIAEILRRIGEEYGGFDTLSPLPADRGGPGAEIVFHIAGDPHPNRPEFSHGTGILRTAKVFADRTDVYKGDPLDAVFGDDAEFSESEQLIARFDDLTLAHVTGERPVPSAGDS